jgi:hypothetical protein
MLIPSSYRCCECCPTLKVNREVADAFLGLTIGSDHPGRCQEVLEVGASSPSEHAGTVLFFLSSPSCPLATNTSERAGTVLCFEHACAALLYHVFCFEHACAALLYHVFCFEHACAALLYHCS